MPESGRRWRLLYAVPFGVFPVQSGGALRSWHLLRELCRCFRVTAFVPSACENVRESILKEVPDAQDLEVFDIPAYRMPRGLPGRLRDRLRTFALTGDWRIPTNGVQHSLSRVMQDWFRCNTADIIMCTNLESLYLARKCRKWSNGAVSVLDLHNIESELCLRRTGGSVENTAYRKLVQQESLLPTAADLVQVCSDHDGALLVRGRDCSLAVQTVSNGVATERLRFDGTRQKSLLQRVLFCGTLNYGPNIEGLNWFCSRVWPQIHSKNAAAELVVVGRGYRAENFPGLEGQSGVRIVGAVEDVVPHYVDCGVSICPLLSGSGTRLKILEAMSAGNPIVSTAIGCEGLQLKDGEEILIRDDPVDFASAVRGLMEKPAEFDALRERARRRAESSYDWRVIGHEMCQQLLAVLAQRQKARLE